MSMVQLVAMLTLLKLIKGSFIQADIFVKNVCDNQGGFTCLGYLGQQDTSRANAGCVLSPKVAKASS
jgi:hypothetical protein